MFTFRYRATQKGNLENHVKMERGGETTRQACFVTRQNQYIFEEIGWQIFESKKKRTSRFLETSVGIYQMIRSCMSDSSVQCYEGQPRMPLKTRW